MIDMAIWKTTLPVGPAEHPTELLPVREWPPWLVKLLDVGWRFRAHCGGTTTSGSHYPRCELRELNRNGSLARWSTTSGKHTMIGEFTITHVPKNKPHVVVAQIHDSRDDVVMVRLEGKRLFVEANGKDIGVLNKNYQLGTRFRVKIRAKDGMIKVRSGLKRISYGRRTSGCYFKAGCYTQSNTTYDAATDYGEVIVHALSVAHS